MDFGRRVYAVILLFASKWWTSLFFTEDLILGYVSNISLQHTFDFKKKNINSIFQNSSRILPPRYACGRYPLVMHLLSRVFRKCRSPQICTHPLRLDVDSVLSHACLWRKHPQQHVQAPILWSFAIFSPCSSLEHRGRRQPL